MNPHSLFDEIAVELLEHGASTGTMFGKRAILTGGKAFACLRGNSLAFRLGAGTPAHADALSIPGAELFDPSGKDRPFKDWVAVPLDHADRWPDLARSAFAAR